MQATLNRHGDNRVNTGHPWVFSNDIEKMSEPQAGWCEVLSSKGKILGSALYSPHSKIALRIYHWGSSLAFDETLLAYKIEHAAKLRKAIYEKAGETCYRMVFAEADSLPSLIIDRYDDLYSFQTLSCGMEVYKASVIKILQERFNAQSICERNDATIRTKEQLPLLKQFCAGTAPEEKIVTIMGKQFEIKPLSGQKTGFFLDQKEIAKQLATYFYGDVLDTFCYQGQFAMHLSCQVNSVLSVDISADALTQLKRNADLNEANNIETQEANVFDLLKSFDQQKRKFDCIILDPPAFVKSKSSLTGAIAGYKEINLRAMKMLNSGGLLATFSCSQHLLEEYFLKLLSQAARDARRQVQIIAKLNQAPDHPVLLTAPETHYLKGYLLRII